MMNLHEVVTSMWCGDEDARRLALQQLENSVAIQFNFRARGDISFTVGGMFERCRWKMFVVATVSAALWSQEDKRGLHRCLVNCVEQLLVVGGSRIAVRADRDFAVMALVRPEGHEGDVVEAMWRLDGTSFGLKGA
jgi:hypothetical protein